MDARQSDPLDLSINLYVDMSFDPYGKLELRDLVPFGQIRVEIIFAREPVHWLNAAMGRQASLDRVLNRLFIQYGKNSRHAQTNGTCIFVGRFAELGRTGTEYFGFGLQLGMNFQPDDRFVFHAKEPDD
jgi:hypothetical protein